MEQFETTMKVFLSGREGPFDRKVSHYERNPDGPGLRAIPALYEGEEIRWTITGECLVIKLFGVTGRFVTALRYEWDFQQVKRIVEYSDGKTYESHVAGMPTQEEIRKEAEDYNALASISFV